MVALVAYRLISLKQARVWGVKKSPIYFRQALTDWRVFIAILVSWLLALLPIIAVFLIALLGQIALDSTWFWTPAISIALILFSLLQAAFGQTAMIVSSEDKSIMAALKTNLQYAKAKKSITYLASIWLLLGFALISLVFSLLSILVVCFFLIALFFGFGYFFLLFHLFACAFFTVSLLFWASFSTEVLNLIQPKPRKAAPSVKPPQVPILPSSPTRPKSPKSSTRKRKRRKK